MWQLEKRIDEFSGFSSDVGRGRSRDRVPCTCQHRESPIKERGLKDHQQIYEQELPRSSGRTTVNSLHAVDRFTGWQWGQMSPGPMGDGTSAAKVAGNDFEHDSAAFEAAVVVL